MRSWQGSTPVVSLRAHAQYVRGRAETVQHPARLAFGRGTVHVTIQNRGDTIGPQPLGQAEHSLAVRVGIMAVTNENGGDAHKQSARIGKFEFFYRSAPALIR